MKTIKYIFACFIICMPFLVSAQTLESIPIGQILDSMPSGYRLLDGTILKAEIITLGDASVLKTGSGTYGYEDHGIYNQYNFGGVFNGFNDGALSPTGPDGNTLPEYDGIKDPLLFTRINSTPRGAIDRGDDDDFGHAVGFHIWTSKPILAKQLLLIDCDGLASSENREWFTIFGYNGTTAVNPSITLKVSVPSPTELNDVLIDVASTWHDSVDAKITGVVPSFTQKTIVRNKTTLGVSGSDPDDLKNQALFDFGSTKTDHLFILWGMRDNLSDPTGDQNSGVSPLVFSFGVDWGDAPNSFGTNNASDGARHVIPDTAKLFLGSGISAESEGVPSPLANSDLDDGVAALDTIKRVKDTVFSYSLNVAYTNNTSSAANYVAWIDWNNDGVFDASEGKVASSPASSTSGSLSFTWTNLILTDTSTDHTYARIRTTTESITTANAKGTLYQDGEVEDYFIQLRPVIKLPIRLISYQANLMDDKVQLQWTVADQVDVDRYEIHRSTNGIDFKSIGFVKADKEQSQYTLWDHPLTGMNLYRLKSVDLDGKYQYAPNTLKVNFSNKNNPKTIFYPNPSTHTLSVNTSGYSGILELKIYSVTGQQVIHQVLDNGLNNIDIRFLNNGIYCIKLTNNAQPISSEIIEVRK